MKKLIAFSALSISFAMLSGCATVANGRFQQVTVQTQPPGANCILMSNKGQWAVNSTPATLQVHRSMDDIHITCQKPGYATNSAIVKSMPKKMLAGNIIAGGLIGAGIDTVDGAGFSYPSIINLTLMPLHGFQGVKTPTVKKVKVSAPAQGNAK